MVRRARITVPTTRTRAAVPKDIEIAILSKSKRRCALCFFLELSNGVARGQIAHIDRDKTNGVERNLAYLCLEHHDAYDTTPSQSKRFQPQELSQAKDLLEEWVQKWSTAGFESGPLSEREIPKVNTRVRPEIFDRRLPVYRAFHRFVVSVVSEGKVVDDELAAFVHETHDALFLYGSKIEKYLHEVYAAAIHLRSIQSRMTDPHRQSDDEWEKAVDKETERLLWFNKQIHNGKKTFYPLLKL